MHKKKQKSLTNKFLTNKLERLFDKVVARTLYVSYFMYLKYESISFTEYVEKYNICIKEYGLEQIEEQIAMLVQKEKN